MTEGIEDEIQQTEQTIEKVQNQFETLEQKVEQLREQKISKLAEKVDFESSDIDVDDLKEFLKRPYLVNEAGENRYEVVVPQFVGFQVGKLDRQVENYNVFVVDKYTKWMTGIPAELQDEIDLDDDPRFTVKGDVLEYDEEDRNTVEEDSDIQDHVSDVTDEKATIKQGHEFELIADLIEKGELPFTPQPVADEDLREPEVNFELRDYQQEGFDRFMDEGHACFCWMTGAGKSFPAIYALDSLRYDEEDAKKAVVVYGKASEQQWKQYFEEFAPRLTDEVEVVTYQSLHKLEGEYALIVYDECDYLPADTFAKGATIPTKYRIGLTASPHREDDRENYIFALTGPPVGLDWETTLDMMEKSYHEINVHVVEDRREKISRIESILDDRRTLVFCDSLDFGEEISDATGLPFVNGEDKNQLERIQENEQVIISRIGDRGISIDDLEVVLEADFLFGSRRQQLQRTGRLFHGEGKRHDIFFTRGEFNKYQKRLYSLIEKGFTLNFVDEEEQIEIPEKYSSRVDLDLQGEKVESDTAASDASSTSRVENMDKIDFLKNDRIQEAIEDAMEGYSRVSDDDMWETLLAIADSEDGMTHTEISQLFESSKSGSRYTKPFREGDPAILVAEKEGKEKRWSLNVEEFQEIIQTHEKRQEKKERISDLKNEIGLS